MKEWYVKPHLIMYMQKCMQKGCSAPLKKPSKKNQEKKNERKNEQNQEFNQNYHNTVYRWVKSNVFTRGNQLHRIFFLNPHLPKINPAYAPVYMLISLK